MNIHFYKYQGTGNDFVMLDNRNGIYDSVGVNEIKKICDRRFGIGADGLIKINAHPTLTFEMDYYNSDGSKSFCGNGARCTVAFADFLGVSTENVEFWAIDGLHSASLKEQKVALAMNNVSEIHEVASDYLLHTGSPHYIQFVDNVAQVDVYTQGNFIRNQENYKREGVNVNFVQVINEQELFVRTYERGVEDETLSCGTGVTAAVLAYGYKMGLNDKHTIRVKTLGGELEVVFRVQEHGQFDEIQLLGPAKQVFKGEIDV
jgi:diaminopimelate epimerase